jgi:hypothetical protein
VALVKRQDAFRLQSRRQHYQRRICKPDVQIAVLVDHAPRLAHVVVRERGDLVGAGLDFLEQSELRVDALALGDQIVDLGEHKRRQHERASFRLYHAANDLVAALISDDRGEEPARVDEDQSSPKPLRTSSNRSARSASLRPSTSGSVGRGRARDDVYSSIAVRMTSASERPSRAATRAKLRLIGSGR